MIDDNVNRHGVNAIIAAIKTQDVDFLTEKELNLGYQMSKAAATSVESFSLDWNPTFEIMLVD